MTTSTSPNIPLHRRILYGLTNWGLFVSGVVNLIVGTWFAAHADTAIAATSLTAGLVLLFAATIDRFESLKGLGVEAKTRKLDEKIEQADEALRKLRQLTELTGAALINLNSKMGRWDSAPSQRESLALVDNVRSIMQGLGSEQSAINTALRPWARILCFDLTSVFVSRFNTTISNKINELEMRRQAIPRPMDPNDPELLRLSEEIKSGHNYLERLRKVRVYELDDYPSCFLSLFDNVPYLTQEEMVRLREETARFASDMSLLKQNMLLPNSESWMRELERTSEPA